MVISGITALLRNMFFMHRGRKGMETINWFDLSDSQKAKLLEQVKAHLQQQIAEAKLAKYALTILAKHGIS
jgi:hypothetical protein